MGGNVSNQVGPLSDEEANQIKILTNFSIEEILSCYENFVKVRLFNFLYKKTRINFSIKETIFFLREFCFGQII